MSRRTSKQREIVKKNEQVRQRVHKKVESFKVSWTIDRHCHITTTDHIRILVNFVLLCPYAQTLFLERMQMQKEWPNRCRDIWIRTLNFATTKWKVWITDVTAEDEESPSRRLTNSENNVHVYHVSSSMRFHFSVINTICRRALGTMDSNQFPSINHQTRNGI